MTRPRFDFTMKFSFDRDMVPGWGDQIEDFENWITDMVMRGSYNPQVEVIDRGITIDGERTAMSVKPSTVEETNDLMCKDLGRTYLTYYPMTMIHLMIGTCKKPFSPHRKKIGFWKSMLSPKVTMRIERWKMQ